MTDEDGDDGDAGEDSAGEAAVADVVANPGPCAEFLWPRRSNRLPREPEFGVRPARSLAVKKELDTASALSAGVSGTVCGLLAPVEDDAESVRKFDSAVAYSSDMSVIVRRIILVTTSSAGVVSATDS